MSMHVLSEAAVQVPAARAASPQERATMLRGLADALEAARDELVTLAGEETHLPAARLTGELARTTFQLRWFADLVIDGSCFDAVIEQADDAFPLGPRPDLRRVLEPVGPVLVFAASNFPFAFSVLGGDTAAALAAGCPVVVKAHPGHPTLSDRVASIARSCGAPLGLVHGVEEGRAALLDPRIKAASFTGSTQAGRALLDLASSRPDPIPFYGELGSVNPAFVSPGAVKARGAAVVDGFVTSFTLGVGQFCTKPGLLFLPAGHDLDAALVEAAQAVAAAPMLGDWIEERYHDVLATRRTHGAVKTLYAGTGTSATLLSASFVDVACDTDFLGEECFGPASIVIEYADDAELVAAAASFAGLLTATVHAEPEEHGWAAQLLDVLRPRVGRVVFNGWPTGVAVNAAMHHGGPWPAATSPLHSAVGGNSIHRFLRPVSYQGVPDGLLPPELQNINPYGIRRRIDGELR